MRPLGLSEIYTTARICLNGHMLTGVVRRDQEEEKYCGACGALAISECETCQSPIRGPIWNTDIEELDSDFEPARYCYNCGRMYPWTATRLKAAKELADELDNLSTNEKESLKRSIEDIVRDAPNTAAAQLRFKRLVSKAGTVALDGFRQIFIEITSEVIRKQMGLTNPRG